MPRQCEPCVEPGCEAKACPRRSYCAAHAALYFVAPRINDPDRAARGIEWVEGRMGRWEIAVSDGPANMHNEVDALRLDRRQRVRNGGGQ